MNHSRFSVDDLLNLNVVGDARVSPDGDRIAYTVSENGAQKGQRTPESRAWMVQIESGESWQVSFGPGTDRSPRWSPDGHQLAILSDREKRGTAQIYLLDDTPREACQLTELSSGVDQFEWSPDGSKIAVTSVDFVPESDNDVKLFDADRRFQRLYTVDVESGASTPIPHGDLHVWEFCWSPDGTSIAAIVSDEPETWAWYSAWLVRIDVETGDVSDLYRSPRQIARPTWSPDGSRIALISCRWSDPGMTGGDVVLIDAASGDARNLTEGEPRSHLIAHWTDDSARMVTVAWEHARAQVCRVVRESGSTPLWTAEMGLNDFGASFSPGTGRIAATLSSPDRPTEVWCGVLRPDDSELTMEPVTDSNSDVTVPISELRWLTWKSTDGRAIEGLYYAPVRTASSAPAMVTLVHGGPTGVATPSFPLASTSGWIPFLLDRGIAVFLPNYRGSNGYGVDFAEANLGDLGGLDLQDVLTGVDACVQQGLADADRLGIGGWSYGGYLTAWAITQTGRFKAAVAGASITNWYSFHGGTNIPGFDRQYIAATPHELDGPYAWTSPLFACKHVTTPTLFLHGEQDPVCPVGQAYEMTRALRNCGVEAECAVYPREPHGFVEREHRRDMTERAVGWFSTHLESP